MEKIRNLVYNKEYRSGTDDLSAWRAEIISSVLNEGLKSRNTLAENGRIHFPSSDRVLGRLISGTMIQSQAYYRAYYKEFPDQSRQVYENNINCALYRDAFSTVPVMLERKADAYCWWLDFHKKPEEQLTSEERERRGILKKRAQSFFLVVCEGDWLVGDRSEDELGPDSFVSLIFPLNIWREYEKYAGPTKEKISCPVITAADTVKKSIFLKSFELTLPDFEAPLCEIIESRGLHDPVWVHGVRLPIEEDLTGK